MKRRILSFFIYAAALGALLFGITINAEASGIDNIAARADYLYNITWTAQTTVKGWANESTFYQGSTYHIPYGQPVSSGKYIYWNVSIDNFLSSTGNASSEFYTQRSYNNYNSGSYSTYYAMDCSAFASYCWDLSSRTITSSWSKLPVTSYGLCTSANVGKIQVGDALNLAGSHVVIVSDVTYDGNGNISKFEITEQTVPTMYRSYYTPSSLVSKYSSYTIYRYNYRDSVSAPPNGEVPVDLGDFYASIINVNSQKNLTNDYDKNSNVTIRTANVNLNQKWKFEHQSDDSYKIISVWDNKCLEVENAGKTSGSNVRVYEDNSTDAQRWYIYKNSNTYYFKSKLSDCVIDIYSGNTEEGTNAQIYDYNGSDAQLFTFWIETDIPNNLGDIFYAYIYNTQANKLLTYDSDSNVTIRTKTLDKNQLWEFTRNTDGSYKIKSLLDGNCLDCEAASDNVHLIYEKDDNAQKWKIYGSNGSYKLKPNNVDNKYMDIYNGNTADGTNVQVYDSNDTYSQKYTITKINLSDIPTFTPIPSALPIVTMSPAPAPTPSLIPSAGFKIVHSSGSAEVTNNSAEAQSVAVIIAEYSGGVLTDITSENITFAAGESEDFTVPDGGKIFIWDSLSGMVPMEITE